MRFNLKTIMSGLLVGILGTSLAAAETFDLTWNTIDGGGVNGSTGGVFELSGTIGQPDAGLLSGGVFTLAGGFWSGIQLPCPADLNQNGVIDLGDLAMLLSHYGQTGVTPSDGDLDGDTTVSLADLASLLSQYGDTCP